MIEIYKLPKLNKEDLEKLKHINPWWIKSVNKLVKKNSKWLPRFGLNPSDYISEKTFEINQYDKLFASVNNIQNFLKPKLKQIKTNKRILKKFQKLINNYMSLVGICWSIYLMINYYSALENSTIENKKKYAIKLGNDKILEFYQRYKNDTQKILGHNNVFETIFKNENILDNFLFNPNLILNSIVKFASNLFTKKETSELIYLDIMYMSMVQNSFNQALINNYQIFTNQIITKL